MSNIPAEIAQQLSSKLTDGDVGWIEASYKSGKLDWLKGLLTPGNWIELPKRIIAKDINWLRTNVGELDVPGFGRLFGGSSAAGIAAGAAAVVGGGLGLAAIVSKIREMLGGTFDWDWLGKNHASGDLDALKGHVKADEWNEFPKRIAAKDEGWFRGLFGRLDIPGFGKLGAAAAAVGAAKVATSAATKTAVTNTGAKKGGLGWLKWLIGLILVGLLALLLSRCGDDDDTVAAVTTAATVASTTAAPTTVAATTGAPTTTVAATTTTKAAATTTAAPTTTVAATTTTKAVAPAPGDIIEVASKAGSFTTLAKLLGDAGLADTLKGPGPFTVFAPTDDAFKKLSPDVLAALAKDPALLRKALTYHVAPGTLTAANLKAGALKTSNGADITIAIAGGKVTINGVSGVTTADIAAKNGVIHVIDTVLIPAGLIPAPAAPTATTLASVL